MRELPPPYVERLLRFLAGELDASRHLHLVLLWSHRLMLAFATRLRESPGQHEVPIRALLKGARLKHDELGRLCNSNLFSLAFLSDQLQAARAAASPLVTATPKGPSSDAAAAAARGAKRALDRCLGTDTCVRGQSAGPRGDSEEPRSSD